MAAMSSDELIQLDSLLVNPNLKTGETTLILIIV